MRENALVRFRVKGLLLSDFNENCNEDKLNKIFPIPDFMELSSGISELLHAD